MPILARSRKRRAAPQDLYPACKQANTCPPDVLAKMENDTWADRILKWASGFLYFGNLGISTGRGTGGGFGYAPIGGSGVATGGRTVVRPGIGANVVVPGEAVPTETLGPLDPSVIPLDTLPSVEPDVLLPPGRPEVYEDSLGPRIPPERLPAAYDEDGPPVHVPAVPADPAVHEGTPAVLEVPTEQAIVSHSQFANPAFEASIVDITGAADISGQQSITVHHGAEGHIIGGDVLINPFLESTETLEGEHIPLRSFTSSMRDEFEYNEETPLQSTPTERPAPRGRRLGNTRYFRQVKVEDTLFLHHPQRLVTFDNPVYEGEDSYGFAEALDPSAPYPDLDFRDLKSLSRVEYGRNPQGLVRVSRVGKAHGTMLRSGLRIGPETHYFMDLSEIAVESELSLHAETSHMVGREAAQVTPLMEEISLISEAGSVYSDSDLLDVIEDLGERLQLVIGSGRNRLQVPLPLRNLSYLDTSGIFVGYVIPTEGQDSTQRSDIEDVSEVFSAADLSPSFDWPMTDLDADFVLHPSLLKRRRRFYWSFADGGLASRTK
ncbi:putative L2 [Equus asinus papillomavirus 1]|uniref:Minor capsid protein L2 n=1 Tax=Equus asinus papillomavirus 1 TaxID=1163703 RepID=W5ZT00_9PAPI|nr:putative L2 [Equus asinus papillomavirus 1]AHI45085.1 putative L2 [Equus asinus papillomavirus 1]